MYKYQKESIEYLNEVAERLEKLTEDKMSLKIGFGKDEFLNSHGTGYFKDSGYFYLLVNHDDRFELSGDDSYYFDYPSDEMYIKFDKNIFLKLNDFIEKIYTEKREREAFHERLNKELEALTKSL